VAVTVAIWLGASGGGAGTLRPGRAGLAPGTIMTVAGGVGGPGPATTVAISSCPLSYADGALYLGDGAVVRRIDTRTGWLTTLAGDGTAGDHGNGVLATDAGLSAGGGTPTCSMSASLDSSGNLLITAGQLHVVAARTGTFYGLPMIAKHIYRLPQPYFAGSDVRADRAGNLVTIATDSQPCGSECSVYPGLVRVLAERTGTFYGVSMLAGRFYTLAGNNEEATAPGNSGPAARAGLGALAQLSLDAAGNLLIADEGRSNANGPGGIPSQIRVLPARDGTFYGQRMRAGDIYSIAGGGRLTADGVPATSALIRASGVTHDAAGNVIIGDGGRVRVVAVRDGRFYGIAMKAGDIYTVAGTGDENTSSGDGGPALRARIDAEFVAVDGAGNLAFTDVNTSKIRVVAAHPGTFYGIAMKAGDVYSVAGTGGATSNALPGLPAGVASDASGDLIIGYQYGTSSGPEFGPARPGTYFGIPMKPGRLYQIPTGRSRFGRCPGAVTADRFGNVLIADQSGNRLLVAPVRSGTFYGQRMRARRIYPVAGDGKPATSGMGGPALAAGFSPASVAADRRGDIFASGPDHRVVMVPARSGTFYGIRMTAGHIYTVAGDGMPAGPGAPPIGNAVPATHTDMFPWGVTVDAAGNLVLATDYRVRVVDLRTGRFYGVSMRAGYIYTVAGPFPGAHAVTVDGHGNILVDDAVANVVRLVAVRSGTFYGQHVTAGHDYVIAGHHHGQAGLGENGPATQAWLDGPDAIAVAPDGRLLIAVSPGQRILAVTP
jgi:hypothetical protein